MWIILLPLALFTSFFNVATFPCSVKVTPWPILIDTPQLSPNFIYIIMEEKIDRFDTNWFWICENNWLNIIIKDKLLMEIDFLFQNVPI